MQDDEITLYNTCTNLVSLRKCEAFPLHLLGDKRPGEWIGVREFCEQVGVAPGELRPELFVAWLPDPLANEAYAVILFYDDESKWSMAAHYNRERLVRDAPANPSLHAAGAIPASSYSPSQQAAPAVEP